jgi:hypothetical protein
MQDARCTGRLKIRYEQLILLLIFVSTIVPVPFSKKTIVPVLAL